MMILLKSNHFAFHKTSFPYEMKSILQPYPQFFIHPSIHPSLPHDSRYATARIRNLSTDSYSNNNIICERVEGNRIPPCFSLGFKPFRHEIFRRSSGDNVVFYFSSPSLFSSSLPPFFFFLFFPPPSIDYRYPIEDSTKLSGGVRASACSFALAQCPGD